MQATMRLFALSVSAMIAAACPVEAATFDATIDGVAYTIVEVDPFFSEGVVGNTTREDGSGTFWTSDYGTGDDGLWYHRTYAGFNSNYTSLPGATDRVFESSWENAAALRIDVTDLPAAVYQVCLLYTDRTNDDYLVGTLAALNDLSANGTFYTTEQAIATLAGTGDWNTRVASLGTTNPGATSFYVGVDEFGGLDQTVERSHVLALAYRQVNYPGDFDGNNKIDGDDLAVWKSHYGTVGSGTSATGDADFDKDVDGADFLVWQRNFGESFESSVVAVPEANALQLAVVCGLIAFAW